MRVQLVSLTLATLVSSVLAANNETCPINCAHGTCVEGETNYDGHPTKTDGKPFAFHSETSRQGHYCDCPDNYTGVRCGRPFTVCDSGHYCYHGGKCVEGFEDAPDLEFCDCTSAHHLGKPYAGKFCEHEAAEKCGDSSDIFCVNEGTCKDDFENKNNPCDCPSGFRGPHCEYERGQVPECTADFCQNGGECEIGITKAEQARYADFWDSHVDFKHCTCPEGFFGPRCEVKGDKCGSNHCFNGGTCVKTVNDDGTTEHVCDCRSANSETASFGGKYCQAESTTFCSKSKDQNGHLFCTNGGTCKEEAHTGCDCPDGYHGPICEFTEKEEAEKCDLDCGNGGQCRKGALDGSILEQYGDDLAELNVNHDGSWEHCVCPDGFFGLKCEHKLEICDGGDHVCLHGSKCVAVQETTGNLRYECDCDAAFDALQKYAGKYCQYTSTDFCTKSGEPGVKRSSFAFCVNDGTCKAKVGEDETHPGCDCTDAFTGEHCEYLAAESAVPASKASAKTERSSFPLTSVLGLILGVVGLAIMGVVLCRPNSQKEDMDETRSDIVSASNESSSPNPETTAPAPPSALDPDQTMENVEIV